MANVDAIDSFDFAKEFKLESDVATKIKAGAEAAAEMNALSARIDSDLTAACGGFAHDLGGAGDYKDAEEACKVALKAIGDSKAKLGAKAKVAVDFAEPRCGVDVYAYADCAARCDASVTPGQVEVKCEPGKMQGQCSGKCQGECDGTGQARCGGTCTGSCSVEMKEPRCTGAVESPKMSAECKARCDAGAQSKAQCTAAHVVVRVVGAADVAAEAAFRKAIEKNLGAVLAVSVGTGKSVERIAGDMKVVLVGVQAAVQAVSDPIAAGRLTACIGAPIKGALDAVSSVHANVSASVTVQASAAGTSRLPAFL